MWDVESRRQVMVAIWDCNLITISAPLRCVMDTRLLRALGRRYLIGRNIIDLSVNPCCVCNMALDMAAVGRGPRARSLWVEVGNEK